MQLTETRKQIIELIEPYMYKTLCEGCIFYRGIKGGEGEYHTDISLYKEDIKNNFTVMEQYIIGHYDITAVLNYLHANIPRNYNGEYGILLQRQWFVDDVKFSIPIRKNSKKYIPNKPLHLYTEEEDKKLFGLLKKLNNEIGKCKITFDKSGIYDNGIKCEWIDFKSFYKDMGDSYEEGLTIERLKVNGNYNKENCCWIQNSEQSNNRRNTIKYKGKSLKKYCEENNLKYYTIWNRIKRLGWDIEKSINT